MAILALDQGTTSTRAVVYDASGNSGLRKLGFHQQEHKQILPHPGWCEQDPRELVKNCDECAREAMRQSGASLTCFGITNQRETLVVWDGSTGEPLHNAVVWHDTRAREVCNRLEETIGARKIRRITGLPISTYFTAVKLLWLKENVEAVRIALKEGRALVGTIDAWLAWRLCGQHVTDVSNASRTMLMDISSEAWSEELCDDLGIDSRCLPRIVSNAERIGTAEVGALARLPLCSMLGDQHASLLGHGCKEGEAKSTFGTGSFVLINTGPQLLPSQFGLITTIGYKLGHASQTVYALEGSIPSSGHCLNWLVDSLGLADSANDAIDMAFSVTDSSGVFFVPALSGLLAPHWRPSARGTILGLSSASGRAHICRAAVEAVCYQTVDVCKAMGKDYGEPVKLLRADGGLARNRMIMQAQADTLGIDVETPPDVEVTARGAAIAAALGHGVSPKEHAEAQSVRFTPSWNEQHRQGKLHGWRRALESCFAFSCNEDDHA